jgi:carboxyl-terminal processing protease
VRKKIKKIKLLIISVFISVTLLLLLFTPAGERIWAAGNDLYLKLNVLNDIIRIINDNYVEVPDWDKIMEGTYRGMLESLDPHSVYIPEEQLSNINEQFMGKFEGVGIEFDILDGYITVIAPIAGSPSEAAGIQAGDKFVKINGGSAYNITREEVFNKLRGPKGTAVNVTVKRHGFEDFDVTIIRDEIPIYSVLASFMIDDSTGYIFLSRFSSTSADEVEEALIKLEKMGMKQLIFDLRGNSGGYLDQAVKVADKFIFDKQLVVYTKGRINSANEEFYSGRDDHHPKFPLIILIDRGSASASEIVAGAVQDLDRGLIVGETSFGKGLVQRQYPLRDESAIRVTVAKYYTPSGRLIQRPYNGNIGDYYAFFGEENRDSLLAAEDSLRARPQYKTVSGRTVYGGGGIAPDYHVKYDRKLTKDTYKLLSHSSRPLFNFATIFTSENEEWREKKEEFMGKFTVSDRMFKDFEKNVRGSGIDIDFSNVEMDANYVKTMLKAEIARDFWGYDEYYKVVRAQDNQVLEACRHLNGARLLLSNAIQ